MTGFIVVVCSFRVSHRFVNILEVSIPLIKAVPSGFAGAKELNLQSIWSFYVNHININDFIGMQEAIISLWLKWNHEGPVMAA